MARLTISLLGPFQVVLDGEPVTVFESDKVRALLAYLAVEAHQPHRRETLAGLFWPEWPERSARHNLSQALLNLRYATGDRARSGDRDATSAEDRMLPFLLVTRQTIRFNEDSDYLLDSIAFAALLAACEKHRHDEMKTCDPCMERLQQAIPLYRGDFLGGFSLADSPAFEEWALLQRERLQRLATDALYYLTEFCEEREELEQALQHAWRWVELVPWQERAHRQLMHLLARSGRRNAALQQYRACRRILGDELGVEPAPKTLELFEQIRDGKYKYLEIPYQKKGAKTRELSKSRPFRLPARAVIFIVVLLSSFGLLAGLLKLNSTHSCADQANIPKIECQALVTLYNETGGSDWKNSSGWLSDTTPCTWFGVMCNGGSVTELKLRDNNLSGPIPPELGDLRRLDILDLYNNLIDGPIPPELGNLVSLTSLDLSYNKLLSGSIPPELGNLSNLRLLTVCGNSQLSGPIPPELGNLVRLESLCLSTVHEGGTQLSGPIPPELGNLTRLQSLDLANCLVGGPIPPELGNLTNLTSLDLSYNQLSGPIPSELGNLTNLKYLSVCGNNHLSGEIPPELGGLFQLESLYLSSDKGGTQLSGEIPPELGNLRRLEYLDISNSLISGPIPPELGDLTNLKYLSLVQNPFSGSLPSELGNLVNLEELAVGEGISELEGSLPRSLMNLKKLKYFTYGTNTDLCAPPDAAFQEWLDSIPTLDGPRVLCQSE